MSNTLANSNDEKWYKKISVEPTMFLYMFAFMLTSVVEQAFYVNKACRVNHGYSIEICDNLDKNDDIKKEVQVNEYIKSDFIHALILENSDL